jgi:hypothetical protein
VSGVDVDHMAIIPNILLIVSFGIAIWSIRVRMREEHSFRRRQLEESAEMLRIHARSLDICLDSKAISDPLKRLLIFFSDGMADESIVSEMSTWLLAPQRRQSNSEAEWVQNEISQLRYVDEDIATEYETAIVSGAYAAMLRWADSAAVFECAGPRFAVPVNHGIILAVKAAMMRSGLVFGQGRDTLSAHA